MKGIKAQNQEGELRTLRIPRTTEHEIARRKRAERTLRDRLLFEEMLSVISAGFINLSFERIDEEIHHAMKKVLNFFKVDRFALLETLPDRKSWMITHCVSGTDVPPFLFGENSGLSFSSSLFET